MIMRRRTVDLAITAALAVVAVVFWKLRIVDPATTPFEIFGNADFYLYIYPMAHRAAAWLRSGVVPLWNPYQYCGHPFLAASNFGVLYPLNVWYLLLPTAWAIEAILVTHLIVAGVLTYAYARVVRLAAPAAAVAALTYMLSGFLASLVVWFPPALAAAAWLPLALLAVERIVERRTAQWACVLAAALALPFLAGWPQTWLYFLYAVGAYTLASLIPAVLAAQRRQLGPVVLLLALGLVGSLGLMAAQLLPTRELQGLGPRRPGGLSLAEILAFGSINSEQLARDLLDVTPGQPRGLYVGITPLLLMALALGTRAAGGVRALCFAVLAVFAIGSSMQSFVFEIYRALPGLMWFRLPSRVLVLWAFAGAMLAGMGAQAIAGSAGRRRISTALVCLAGIALLALTWWGRGEMPRATLLHLGIGFALVLAGSIATGSGRQLALAGIVAVIIWDLGAATRNSWMRPIHNPELIDGEAALLGYVKAHQGLDRTYLKPAPLLSAQPWRGLVAAMEKQGTLREIYSITDYEPLSLDRYRAFYSRIAGPPARPIPPTLFFTGALAADPARPEFRMLDLLCVRFIALARSDTRAMVGLTHRVGEWRPVPVPAAGRYFLFERTEVLPRAYVAFDPWPVRNPDEALDAVSDAGFDPRRKVVVEDVGPAAPAGAPAEIVPARIVGYEPTRVVVEAEAMRAGYLVLTDTFYPGWYAAVDGETQPIVRANYLFRAVALGPGRHLVTFTYAPASFRAGAVISLATLATMALAVAWSGLGRRRRGRRGVAARVGG